MAVLVPSVPAVRIASRLHLASTFFPCSSTTTSTGGGPRRRRGSSSPGPPAALTVDVRVVIRRHFPAVVGGAARTVEKVAEDIALRRRPSRKLRAPESVARALVEDVLPFVRHKFDRGAVVTASKEICAYVSTACADARLAYGGAGVLVLVDTFVCPGVVFRAALAPRPPCKPVMTVTSRLSKTGSAYAWHLSRALRLTL